VLTGISMWGRYLIVLGVEELNIQSAVSEYSLDAWWWLYSDLTWTFGGISISGHTSPLRDPLLNLFFDNLMVWTRHCWCFLFWYQIYDWGLYITVNVLIFSCCSRFYIVRFKACWNFFDSLYLFFPAQFCLVVHIAMFAVRVKAYLSVFCGSW
jgi:hypothetical protein